MSVEELMRNEAFLAKLSDAANMAEVQEIFAKEGVAVTEDQLLKYTLPEGGELDEDALEGVAGGSVIFSPFINWLRSRKSKTGGGHRF